MALLSARPPETTYNQSGPTPVHKGELNLVLGNNLFVTGRVATVGGGFQLVPQGGMDARWYIDDGGIHHGSQDLYRTDRPQTSYTADGNFFRGRTSLRAGRGRSSPRGSSRSSADRCCSRSSCSG